MGEEIIHLSFAWLIDNKIVDFRPQFIRNSPIYFCIHIAKLLGARYDGEKKKWYIPPGVDEARFDCIKKKHKSPGTFLGFTLLQCIPGHPQLCIAGVCTRCSVCSWSDFRLIGASLLTVPYSSTTF